MICFIDGHFPGDEKNPCMCCKNYINWGCNGGDCALDGSYVNSAFTCKKFERDTDTFDENNEFISDEARDNWFA